ncbi:uncharacterized protein EV154DRAFT_485168 [Mucor mucedo]|uniref:uncharacterized protein n=1 Tax=Mucor mucedo TaxID=29922 RepID=UPI00221EFFFB|nr:uncharacterized protein EV154DRAFT_485168 [Mucor mucedo]KAI7886214.1 hypothetical protein EV154DRAFT_485168 [Mucor mucedo]
MMQTIAFYPAFFSSALLVSSRKRKLFSVALCSSEQEKRNKRQKLFSPAAVRRRVRLCVAQPRISRARRYRPSGVRRRLPLSSVCAPAHPLSFLVAASPRFSIVLISLIQSFKLLKIKCSWFCSLLSAFLRNLFKNSPNMPPLGNMCQQCESGLVIVFLNLTLVRFSDSNREQHTITSILHALMLISLRVSQWTLVIVIPNGHQMHSCLRFKKLGLFYGEYLAPLWIKM